jgi:hypothetical protein
VLLDSNYFNGGAPGSDGIRRELPRK